MKAAWIVYLKELVDALRDRRTLLVVLLSSVAVGPAVLVLVSQLVAGIEKRAEAREIVVSGLQHAPTLRNFLERQTYALREAPADYERQLKDSRLGDPVLVVPADFEAALRRGEPPLLELVSSAGNQRSLTGAGPVLRLLRAFNQEQATLRLAVRAAAPRPWVNDRASSRTSITAQPPRPPARRRGGAARRARSRRRPAVRRCRRRRR